MELLYVWIDKYRQFETQGIAFSNRFIINFDPGTQALSIDENKDYVDIYPTNINNISVVVGKNASGKSSLLSLLGERIESRFQNAEVHKTKEDTDDKHFSLLDIKVSSGVSDIEFVNSYFMLYYVGRDASDEHMFVLECVNPEKYVGIFSNSAVLLTKDRECRREIDYFIGKGWFAAVFKIMEEKPYYLQNTCYYRKSTPENPSIEKEGATVLFKLSDDISKFPWDGEAEEDKISIKKHEVQMQSKFLFNQLQFLCRQMNNKKSELYQQSAYTVEVLFHNGSGSVQESQSEVMLIEPYSNFNIASLSKEEHMTLKFLYRYACYAVDALMKPESAFRDEARKKYHFVKTMLKKGKSGSTYHEAKEYYCRQVKWLFSLLESEYVTKKDVEARWYSFLHSVNVLEVFLRTAPENNIELQTKKNGFHFLINASSNIEQSKSVFEEVLDESSYKKSMQMDSNMNSFISTAISYFSTGEQANLALYTAIDEQISVNLKNKKKFILFLDEIERFMHPEMCRNLISELIAFLGQYRDKQFQIILSTHSPFVVSDIWKENIICLSRNNETNKLEASHPSRSPFGQNIHTILKNEFFLSSTYGAYAQNQILFLNSLFNDETCNSLDEAANRLNTYLKKHIVEKDTVLLYLERYIDNVGEIILQRQLQVLFERWKDRIADKAELIAFYRKKIEMLESTEGTSND